MSINLDHRLSTIVFDDVIQELTSRFVGRAWLFKKIDSWLAASGSRCLLLIGEPGVGKSTIAAQLIKTHTTVVAHHFCIAGRGETILPTNVLLSIAAQLTIRVPGYAEALANVVRPLQLTVHVQIDAQALMDSQVQGVVINNLYASNSHEILDLVLRRPLALLRLEQPIIIVIDSLDEAATISGADSLISLMAGLSDLPSSVRLVMTTRPDETRVMPYLTHLSPAKIDIFTDTEDAKQDIADYARLRLSEPTLSSAEKPRLPEGSTEIVTKVVDLSQGNFLYARVFFDELSKGLLTIEEIDTLLPGVDELYGRFLLRLLSEWQQGYHLILNILAVAVEPISEADLASFMDDFMNEGDLRRRLGVLRQFLDEIRPRNSTPPCYKLFHSSFQNYLTDDKRSGQFWCSRRDGNRLIVESCWNHYPNRWQSCGAYGIRNLVQHLYVLSQIETNPNRIERTRQRLNDLFTGGMESGRNSWFAVRNMRSEIGGYLADLELARQTAEESFGENPAVSMGLQCRCALFLASQASVADNLSSMILIRLLETGSWTPEQAIAYAVRAPEPSRRATLLADLVPHLHETNLDEALEHLVRIRTADSAQALAKLITYPGVAEKWLLRIWDQARNGLDEYYQPGIGMTLAWRVPELAGPAFRFAATVRNPNFFRNGLKAAIEGSPAVWPPETLDLFRSIRDEQILSLAITELGRRLPETIRRAVVDMAFDIENKQYRAVAIAGVREFLTADQSEAALHAAMECNELYTRLGALIALSPTVPGSLEAAEASALQVMGLGQTGEYISSLLSISPGFAPKVYLTAKGIASPHHRADLFIALMPFHPEAAGAAVEAVAEIDNSGRQEELLARIWENLPPALWPRTLSIAKAWRESEPKVTALAKLIEHCDPALYSQVIDMIREIVPLKQRAKATAIVAKTVRSDYYATLAGEVFEAIEGEGTDDIEAFAELAGVLPAAAHRTLNLIPTLATAHERQVLLDRVVGGLSADMIDDAVRCSQVHYDFPEQAMVARALSAEDASLTDWAVQCAHAILDQSNRADALIRLLPRRPELKKAAFEALANIPVAAVRYQRLQELLPHTFDDDWTRIKAILRGLEEGHQSKILQKALSLWPSLNSQTIIDATESFSKAEARADVLFELVGLGTKPPDASLVEAVRRLSPECWTTRRRKLWMAKGMAVPSDLPRPSELAIETLALIDCALQGEASTDEALTAALSIGASDHRRAYALSRLVVKLSEAQLDRVEDALTALLEMEDVAASQVRTRRELLIAVAVRRSRFLDPAVTHALFENPKQATSELEPLLPVLQEIQLDRIAKVVAALSDPADRAYGFGYLLPCYPVVDPLAIQSALEIQTDSLRARVLVWLSRRTVSAVPYAVQAGKDSYELLSKIPNFQDVALPSAMECALKLNFINNRNYRAEAFQQMMSALLSLGASSLHVWFRKILVADSLRERSELLKDLASVIPIVRTLGGPPAIAEVGKAIQLTVHFWP